MNSVFVFGYLSLNELIIDDLHKKLDAVLENQKKILKLMEESENK